jgi:copper transport protein
VPSAGTWRLAGALALLATLIAPALPVAEGGRVLAHAQLVASSPAAGDVLPASPEEIRLVFSEPLESAVSSLDIDRDDGTQVLTRVGEVDPADQFVLVVPRPRLPDGVYVLTWRSLSAADGHTATGFLTFGIGDVGTIAPSSSGMLHGGTDPVGVIGRWLTYIGLLLALGLAVFHRVVIREGPMPPRLVSALGLGLFISAGATLAVALAGGLEAGAVADYLLGGRNGALQVGRALVAAAGGLVLLLVASRMPASAAGPVAATTGLVGIVLLVAAGHSSAVPGGIALVNQAVHVTGAAVWIGGIVGLLAVVVRPDLVVEGQAPTMRTLVPRFSALALTAIGMVALTGVYASYAQTGVLLDPGTEWGRTLLLKSGFALGAFALGGLNFLDGGRMRAWLAGFRDRITAEVMLAAVVLALTAALAVTPPVDEPTGVAIEPIPDALGEVAPHLTMDVVPGRPGINRIVITTTDALAGATSLEITLDDLAAGTTTRIPLRLQGMAGMQHGDGTTAMTMTTSDGTADWTADALVLPANSRWDATVRILDAGTETELTRQRFAFSMSAGGIDEGRVVSLINPATMIAGLLVIGGGLGLGLGLGGASLPRCEAVASRIALLGGGGAALVLGALIGLGRLTSV